MEESKLYTARVQIAQAMEQGLPFHTTLAACEGCRAMKRATSLRWSPSLVISLKEPYLTVTVMQALCSTCERSSVPSPFCLTTRKMTSNLNGGP
jgi:hypothetical protein